MRRRAPTITLVSEVIDEKVREKKVYLKATIKIPLLPSTPGLKTSINVAQLPQHALRRQDPTMSDRESGMGTPKYKVVLIEPANFNTNPANFALLTDIPLPNGSYINLDWEPT